MSFDLGDAVPLSITILDATGQPADAGQVDLTITLPDGTTDEHGPIAPTTPGVYDVDYPTVQAGRHLVRWVATGANASAYTDSFDVSPDDRGTWISVSDFKAHLKQNQTAVSASDEKLRGFIAAACDMITNRMGAVAPVTVVSVVPLTRRGSLVLPKRPVISITSVETYPGMTAITGWALESTEGIVSVPSGMGQVRVTYRAGRSPVPARFRLAALELAADLFRFSQHNSGGGRPSLVADDQVVPGVTYALPYRVRQLLGLDKLPRDEVFVA